MCSLYGAAEDDPQLVFVRSALEAPGLDLFSGERADGLPLGQEQLHLTHGRAQHFEAEAGACHRARLADRRDRVERDRQQRVQFARLGARPQPHGEDAVAIRVADDRLARAAGLECAHDRADLAFDAVRHVDDELLSGGGRQPERRLFQLAGLVEAHAERGRDVVRARLLETQGAPRERAAELGNYL